jgi:hypothetical protein
MRALDRTNAFLFLHVFDALMKFFHLRPMHFGPEMVFGMVAVVEKQPIVDFSVAAYTPGDRFIGICTIMPIEAVEITEAVAEVPKRQEIKNHVSPVEQEHYEERSRECGQLEVTPENVAIVAFAQFSANCSDIVPKETQEHIAPWIFRFAVVTVTINGQPINSIALFVLTIGIPLVMLHMHGVVHRLRKTAGDGLCDSKNPIQSVRTEERIVNEVVSHPVDIRIDHQRINEPENQHHPQRRMRIKEKQSNEINQGRSIRITSAFIGKSVLKLRYRKVDWQVLKIAKGIATRLN